MAEESNNSIFDKDNFLSVYSNDIINAAREVLIVSPFLTRKRTLQMMQYLMVALENKVRVIVVTRPGEDFKEKDRSRLQETVGLMKDAGISIIFKSQIYQKYAIIDQRLVWYGSINLLSFGNAEESIMRLDSPNIANELIWSMENK
ncbi:phospholipase D-like domain-containing protein [Desulfosporosinus sp. PR]|nr:phospholipase D-like domain-containing protein [Desulfosporosinus sp. PR]